MTAPLEKFNADNYLLLSQVIEFIKTDGESAKMDELCDVIAVCCQLIEDHGYDPVERFSARADEKGGDGFRLIYAKYREKFGVILDEIRKQER